ncbi:hypothetical protein [Motiliproteus sp. SC1-56]|uniref:hypothetical protein n=1 Tax=Motiliproteus sp. SC1-56 TaxID=2799565 RepID=UPI001A8C2EDF|nr:hypothetical protein [Motiliproteus sp. SC1-56]
MYGESGTDATLIMLAQTLLAPIGIMLLALGLWALLARQRAGTTAFWTLGLALAFWVSGSWIGGRIGLPPQRATDILVLMGAGGLILEWLHGRTAHVERWWRLPVVLAVTLTLLGWQLWSVLGRMEGSTQVLHFLALGLLFLALYGVGTRPRVEPVRDALWMLIAAGAAPVIALDGTLVLGQLAGALAAGCGVIWLAGLVFGPRVTGLGVAPPLLLVALLSAAYLLAGVNPLALLLVAVGPLLIALLRGLHPLDARGLDNLRTLVAGVAPLGLALWTVWPDGSGY